MYSQYSWDSKRSKYRIHSSYCLELDYAFLNSSYFTADHYFHKSNFFNPPPPHHPWPYPLQGLASTLQRQSHLYILFWELRAASDPISTFTCLWAIYIFPGSVRIFPPAEKADPSWKYIIRSQTHQCGNWHWGPDIPFLGIFVSNFRHFVFAAHDSLIAASLTGRNRISCVPKP